MKKGVYLIYDSLDNTSGVNKKIRGQINAFKMNGCDISTVIMKVKQIPLYKLFYRLPFTNISPIWKWEEQFRDIDFLYFRRPLFQNFYFVRFLRKIKKENNNIKIIMEIPTFPYDKELLENWRNIPIYLKERVARIFIKKYIDRIAILTDDPEVFGISTVKIINGFNFIGTERRNYKKKREVNLVAVALFDKWHGYERLLYGLSRYYMEGGQREIVVHFVGDGPEKDNYEKLAKELNIYKNVKFYGMLSGEELQKVYDCVDIGLCSMGLYKIGVDYSCVLKSREYIAVGLPMVTGAKMDIMDIDELRPFILDFPNNESIIDVKAIIMFYDKLYSNEEKANKMIDQIRDIGIKNLSMKDSIKKVIEYIEY